ncbi:hypothetical protein HL667_06380 [Bradyrhizobium sp. 83012]|uniref:Uncharacterized protein n=1 Tax=Bradyrhizobium aeschynomenes TaxID=2734909 RepID=A0ABX2C8M5_9BRAD|nr:hypothetical protein [Bradyrhizobium aeschynomenes]NPU64619.1 hypothetical protein [Bradyrhizobium aeschynomenes]
MLNRDQLNNADAERVASSCIGLLDRLQNYPAHIQPLTLACTFLVLSAHLRVPAQDLFNLARNMMAEEENIAEFKAVTDYIKYEIER